MKKSGEVTGCTRLRTVWEVRSPVQAENEAEEYLKKWPRSGSDFSRLLFVHDRMMLPSLLLWCSCYFCWVFKEGRCFWDELCDASVKKVDFYDTNTRFRLMRSGGVVFKEKMRLLLPLQGI